MADLDDFFAKKDRKKAKGKKFTTTEEIAKKLEETGKRVEKIKLKEKNPEEEETQQQQEQEDEEWREFEEEKKDYTGLKLGNLQVSENFCGDTDDDRGTGDNSSDGEGGEPNLKSSGPWKKPADVPATGEVAEPPKAAPPLPTSSINVVGGVYKSPHLRNQSAAPQNTRSRMKNIAPDIRSEEYFPTLNAKQPQAVESAGPWGRRKRDEGTFEEVRNRGGSRSYTDSQTEAPKLSLDNKYGALSQDQS